MGGKVLDYEAKRLLNEGREEGRELGKEEGITLGRASEIIETGLDFELPEKEILDRLQSKLGISLQRAQEYLLQFGGQRI
ncbi:MAG: hypothetical protein NC321_02490 [Clostridium sp.]|nr:hypothetical protein [Clostridium sp.]